MADSVTLLREVLDALKDPIFVLDSDCSCVFANRGFFQFLGLEGSPEGTLATTEFWPDVARADLRKHELTCELKLQRGDTFTVKLSIGSVADGFYLIRVLAGISGKDTIQNFHSQRLETLGMLAGGVAHDFNNVLAGILGHTTYLKTILPKQGPHVESLGAVEEGAKKASSIVQQILNFSKLDTAEKLVSINLCDLVTRTCSLLRGAISPEFKLQPVTARSAVPVLAVEGKLAQVIVNLVINARDAIRSGGVIRVGVSEFADSDRLKALFGTADLACGRYAVLDVEDNGHGMSPDVLGRIFEPYFSTKKEKGTGLGLSTVAAIVRSFGGVIEVTSEVNVGTRVAVYLPIVDSSRGQIRSVSERAEHGLETGTESVLVIDDESPVRNVLALSLQHLGYAVEVAESGVFGIEKFCEEGKHFDLVILDMLMPQLSGEKVFFKLQAIDPKVKVLVISGYASEEAVRNILSHGGLDFVQKPFTIEELSKRVRACLDGRVGATAEAGKS